MKTSPYADLPPRQFWKTAVANVDLESVRDIYKKKWPIDDLRIAAAGSCFAQHISARLREAGYTVLDKEKAFLPDGARAVAREFGYRIYSTRYGNIYTVRRLLQLLKEAHGELAPSRDELVWERDGRYFDALRPSVEPEGLSTPEEVLAQRADHLWRVRNLFAATDLFIFTLGLTEAWINRSTGLVYALSPGAGGIARYDPDIHEFKNFSYLEIYEDFVQFRDLAKAIRPGMKFLLTVSPVPLAATAVDSHVLPVTIRSKSTLRAVAGQLYDDFEDIDYFPSYELLSTPFMGDSRFEANKRDVSAAGVDAVMALFFQEHRPLEEPSSKVEPLSHEDALCEEILLEAFAP